MGYPLAITIETIKDIDAVASINDTIIIDSPEKIEGKVLNYPKDFKKVVFINSKLNKIEFDGAYIINTYLDYNFLYKKLTISNRKDKTIFIYGDSDYEKTILKNLDLFKNKGLDLYWGVYFFVKYENILKDVFNNIIDSEEYYEVLKEYKNIITCSLQVAIEAKANGANVLFLELKPLSEEEKKILEYMDINYKKTIADIKNTDNKKYLNLNLKYFDKIINFIS